MAKKIQFNGKTRESWIETKAWWRRCGRDTQSLSMESYLSNVKQWYLAATGSKVVTMNNLLSRIACSEHWMRIGTLTCLEAKFDWLEPWHMILTKHTQEFVLDELRILNQYVRAFIVEEID